MAKGVVFHGSFGTGYVGGVEFEFTDFTMDESSDNQDSTTNLSGGVHERNKGLVDRKGSMTIIASDQTMPTLLSLKSGNVVTLKRTLYDDGQGTTFYEVGDAIIDSRSSPMNVANNTIFTVNWSGNGIWSGNV